MEEYNKSKKWGKYEIAIAVLMAVIIIGVLLIVLRLTNVIGPNRNNKKPDPTATAKITAAPTDEPETTSEPTKVPTATPEITQTPTAAPTATPEPTTEPVNPIKSSATIEVNSELYASIFKNTAYKGEIKDVYYKKAPSINKVGDINVILCATVDGVYKEYNAVLRVVDTTPPKITGVGERAVAVGKSIAYMWNVKATDNSGETIEVKVDSSKVDLYHTGTYEAVYSAKDSSGNVSTAVAKIVVVDDPATVSVETVNAEADKILAKIFKTGMTDKEKLLAIYRYIKRNTGYTSNHSYNDIYKNAYQGMTQYYGDCYVYFCYAKVLLDRAGFENLQVTKTKTEGHSAHYWNLVYVNGGWYHYDTTPRKDNFECCLLTDAELKAYSDTHDGTHVFDSSAYPERATTPLGIVPNL